MLDCASLAYADTRNNEKKKSRHSNDFYFYYNFIL